MLTWFSSADECAAYATRLEELRSGIETFMDGLNIYDGICPFCETVKPFRHRRPLEGGWSDLRENIVCECGLNGRMRMIFDVVRHPLRQCVGQPVIFERNTILYNALQKVRPDLLGTEYLGEDCVGGRLYPYHDISIRHEDMMNLSLSSNSVALIVHGDVLEHVPDPVRALTECYRVLQPGGVMYFTTPFFFQEHHFVRARQESGKMCFLAEKVYHGNPVSAEGSLVFVEFGKPLLGDIVSAGFPEAYIGMLYSPLQGIVGNNNPYASGRMWPIIFKAVK